MDNGAPVVRSTSLQVTRSSLHPDGWMILHSPKINENQAVLTVDGYVPQLGKYLSLAPSGNVDATPVAPILVKQFEDSGAYLCSFPCVESLEKSGSAVTILAYPYAEEFEIWKSAFEGDAEAANKIGLSYSFLWDDIDEPNRTVDYRVAKYWFLKAATSGSALGAINYGCLCLRGLAGEANLVEAWKYFMNGAYGMLPESYGHLGKMLLSGFDDYSPESLGLLLLSMERHLEYLRLIENCNSGGDIPGKEIYSEQIGFCYSPREIDDYSHVEIVSSISKLKTWLPSWNLFWLSVDGIDVDIIDNDVASYHAGLDVPRGIVKTLLFDMDSELAEGVLLSDALRMHPRRFLHFFESADVSNFHVSKKFDGWKDRVIERATEAGSRISESVG